MDPLTMMAIGAGVGVGKNLLFDAPRERKDRELAAATARYSPWTGMQPQQVQRADMLGNAMQGGMTGAMLGQSMDAQASQKGLIDAQKSAGVAASQGAPGSAPMANAAPYQPRSSTWDYLNGGRY